MCAIALSTALVSLAIPAANAATPAQVGVVPAGQVSFSYVGQIQQNATIVVDVGYVTSIAGLSEAALFAGSDPLARSESTARFTYFASGQLKTRSINGNIFATSGTAQTTLYLSEQGGASFADPTSFKRGTAIATWSSQWHDIVNVQSPNKGVAVAESDETQHSASPFTLAGTQYVFGADGLLSRLSFTGEGTRTDPIAPRATILYSGVDSLLQQGGLPTSQTAATGVSAGWAYAATAVAAVALGVAVAALVAGRRRRQVP